jgi:hypothetical protein
VSKSASLPTSTHCGAHGSCYTPTYFRSQAQAEPGRDRSEAWLQAWNAAGIALPDYAAVAEATEARARQIESRKRAEAQRIWRELVSLSRHEPSRPRTFKQLSGCRHFCTKIFLRGSSGSLAFSPQDRSPSSVVSRSIASHSLAPLRSVIGVFSSCSTDRTASAGRLGSFRVKTRATAVLKATSEARRAHAVAQR